MMQVQPFQDSNLFNMPSLFNSPSLFGSSEAKAPTQYSVGQDVMVYSESGKNWVSAKVTYVAPNGCVTVEYGSNQKTLEPERHHLLRPAGSNSGPQSGGQPMFMD